MTIYNASVLKRFIFQIPSMGEVSRPVSNPVGLDMLAVLILATAIYIRCNTGSLARSGPSNRQTWHPSNFLAHALGHSVLKMTFRLQRHDGHNKLSHRCVLTETLQWWQNMIGHVAPALPNTGQVLNVFFCRQITRSIG